MKKEVNQIDQLFKSKLLQREFAFDEKAWLQAEKMLDNRSKGGLWFFRNGFIGISAFLLTASAVLWAVNDSNRHAYQIMGENTFLQAEMIEIQEAGFQQFEDSPIESSVQKGEVAPNFNSLEAEAANPKVEQVILNVVQVSTSAPQDQPSQEKQEKEAEIGLNLEVEDQEEEMESVVERSEMDPNDNSEASENGVDLDVLASQSEDEFAGPSENPRMIPLEPSLEADYEKEVIDKKQELLNKKSKGNNQLSSIGFIGGYGPGIATAHPTDEFAYQHHAFVGITYGKKVYKDFYVFANLLYDHSGRMKLPVSFESITYDFGFESQHSRVITSTVNRITLPVYVNYYFKNRHNLYAGIELSSVLSARTKTINSRSTSFDSLLNDNTTQKNLVEHLNTFQYGFLGGYDFLINENFQMGIRYRQGLTSVLKEEYYSKKYVNRQLLFTLTYHLSKK